MKNKTILISGASIAGLSLAYWLKKYGFTPTIVEKHPTVRTGGYKLDIRGVAVEVIKRMGVYEAICANKTDISSAMYVDKEGNIVSETTPDLIGVRHETDLEINRGTLCQILWEQVKGVECLFGDSITRIGENVEFEKSPPRKFDLIIGADGLHSQVRKLVFGEETQFLSELGFYVSIYSVPNFLKLERCEIEYHLPQKFVIAYNTRGDAHTTVGFCFCTKEKGLYLRKKEEQQRLVYDAFKDVGWEAPRFLEAMKGSPDFFFDTMAQVHMSTWSKGRIALVGDAAYAPSPLSGQGTSVALVGAYVLAGELTTNYENALANYEKLMRPFIKKNQKLVQTSIAVHSWLLPLLMYITPKKIIDFFKQLALKRTIKASNAIILKNY